MMHGQTKIKFNILIFNLLMPYKYIETEGSSSGRRFYIELWYGTFTCISVGSLVGRRVQRKQSTR